MDSPARSIRELTTLSNSTLNSPIVSAGIFSRTSNTGDIPYPPTFLHHEDNALELSGKSQYQRKLIQTVLDYLMEDTSGCPERKRQIVADFAIGSADFMKSNPSVGGGDAPTPAGRGELDHDEHFYKWIAEQIVHDQEQLRRCKKIITEYQGSWSLLGKSATVKKLHDAERMISELRHTSHEDRRQMKRYEADYADRVATVARLHQAVDTYQTQISDSFQTLEDRNEEIAALKEDLQNQTLRVSELTFNGPTERQSMTKRIEELEVEKTQENRRVTNVTSEFQKALARLQKAESKNEILHKNLAEIDNSAKLKRTESTLKAKGLSVQLNRTLRELTEKETEVIDMKQELLNHIHSQQEHNQTVISYERKLAASRMEVDGYKSRNEHLESAEARQVVQRGEKESQKARTQRQVFTVFGLLKPRRYIVSRNCSGRNGLEKKVKSTGLSTEWSGEMHTYTLYLNNHEYQMQLPQEFDNQAVKNGYNLNNLNIMDALSLLGAQRDEQDQSSQLD